MKNLKKIVTTFALAGIIMMGVSSTQAGIMMSDLNDGDNQTPCNTEIKADSGIILSGITGIILSGFTGILLSDFFGKDCVKVDSGILMSD